MDKMKPIVKRVLKHRLLGYPIYWIAATNMMTVLEVKSILYSKIAQPLRIECRRELKQERQERIRAIRENMEKKR